jgi:geranylgeranylglycerol-phosphate geranylgeranyltransferase
MFNMKIQSEEGGFTKNVEENNATPPSIENKTVGHEDGDGNEARVDKEEKVQEDAKKNPPSSLWAKIDNFISFIEKDRLSIFELFMFVFVIFLIRAKIELLLPNATISQELLFFAQDMTFYFMVFFAGVIILSLVTPMKPRKAMNVMSVGFLLLLMVPILDTYVFHFPRVEGYIRVEDIPVAMGTYWTALPDYISPGQIVLFTLLFLANGIYVGMKTRSILRGITASVATYYLTLFTATMFASFPQYIYLPLAEAQYTKFLRPFHLFVYTIICIILGTTVLFMQNRKLTKALVRNIRPFRSFHFLLMVTIGVMVSGHIDIINIFSYPHVLNLPFVGITLIIVFLCWQFTVVINDVFDLEVDKSSGAMRPLVMGMISKKDYMMLGMVCGVSALALSLVFNWQLYILTSLFLFSGIVYSVPWLGIRKKLYGLLFPGIWSVLAFLMGYGTSFIVEKGMDSPPFLFPIYAPSVFNPTISGEPLMVAIVIFLALATGTMVKDFKDYEGDKKAGNRTLFTVYGVEQGTKLASLFLFISFISPVLLFHTVVDLALILGVAVVSVLIFLRYKNVKLTFGLYFSILLWLVLRYLDIISL